MIPMPVSPRFVAASCTQAAWLLAQRRPAWSAMADEVAPYVVFGAAAVPVLMAARRAFDRGGQSAEDVVRAMAGVRTVRNLVRALDLYGAQTDAAWRARCLADASYHRQQIQAWLGMAAEGDVS